MYGVLICDDEKDIRNALRYISVARATGFTRPKTAGRPWSCWKRRISSWC